MFIYLFMAITAHAYNNNPNNDSTFERAARISCQMVQNQGLHDAEKQRLRRMYFKRIYTEFEPNPITDAESLASALPACE